MLILTLCLEFITMRCLYRFGVPAAFLIALLAVAAPGARAQTPTPTPTPTTPKPAEVPDPLTDLERAAQLKDKPQYRPSEIKPVKPLFNPDKQALFTGQSDYRKPGRLKIGAYFPSGDTLRDGTSNTYVAISASVDLPPRGRTRPLAVELYVDSAFSSQEGGDKASLVAGGVGYRLYPGARHGDRARVLSNPRFFLGAGVGAYFLNYDINGVQNDGVKLGGKAALGFDFVGDWSLEATTPS